MSKSFDVVYISTPRHGYFKVNGDDLREIKISQSFSEYSYFDEDNDIFYLEEDCDASKFLVALRKAGVTYSFVESNTNRYSKIRNYANFTA